MLEQSLNSGYFAMHEELPFRIIFVVLYVMGFFMRGYVTSGLKKNCQRILPKAGNMRNSSRFRIVFQRSMFFLWIFIVVSYAWYPSWMNVLKLPFPLWLRYGGAGAGFMAFVLLIATMKSLGRYWSPLPQLMEGHELITSGPYRFVRHPMYAAMMVLFVSFALVTANVLVTISSLLAILLTLKWCNKEERMLMDHFGDEYREYMKHSGRFFPRP
ncbi:MAG: isoprenylcysteine carboxylmethyltransferase family protein [Chlorobium phaeobacteroides]|uniref:Isoprenylcysteine carboxyl methyltransferase n=1 Tax=Chlorobium phaeobacteroides (strain BS1) TaxID=331678 RepID=B3EL17_CHLPB|nr:isoprenylcysteine carboxylmethyltransferase family protein [Chlorobium phaeobacteroides]MBL6955297.1 isoprenylcysteine carboxylmethyltransferase family protein [Chlorobium phaeobacteroides]NEX13426.1 isoprenylcysteine carboxylmethyltransferase family protein [Prosthecochloris sp.]